MKMNLDILLSYLDERHDFFPVFAEKYSEPGYKTDKKYIMLGNWNNLPNNVVNFIERRYEVDWEDEWVSCDNCGGLFRIKGDSYKWSMYGHIFTDSCEVICGNCIKENPNDYLNYLTNNANSCDTIGLDLVSLGYELIEDDFENGFYGTKDKPTEILEKAMKQRKGNYIFSNLSVEQFRMNFSLYFKP